MFVVRCALLLVGIVCCPLSFVCCLLIVVCCLLVMCFFCALRRCRCAVCSFCVVFASWSLLCVVSYPLCIVLRDVRCVLCVG